MRELRELTVEAKLENLEAVLEFIREALADAGCVVKVQKQIAIAVEELFVNISQYAYRSAVGGAVIRIAAGDEIVIEFEDAGVAFNPLERADPDVKAGPDERGIGGLGIFMVKNMMDAMDYRREGNKNIITVKKAIKKR